MKCEDCEFFGDEEEKFNDTALKDEGTGYFTCNSVQHDEDREYKKGQGAVVVDGECYFAALRVEKDFGCVKWSRKVSIRQMG